MAKKTKKIDMALYHQAVEEIRSKLRRPVKPSDIVKAAESPKSILHGWFTWDLARGFRKNLLHEARQLLGHLKVIYHDPATGEEVPVRQYVRLMVQAPSKKLVGGYIPRSQAINVPKMHQQMVEIARQMLESFIGRFRGFQRIEPVFVHVRKAVAALGAQAGRKVSRKAQ